MLSFSQGKLPFSRYYLMSFNITARVIGMVLFAAVAVCGIVGGIMNIYGRGPVAAGAVIGLVLSLGGFGAVFLWIKKRGAFEPIISTDLFYQAQKIFAERASPITNDELLDQLRKLLEREGRLGRRAGCHSSGVCCDRWGQET